MRIAVFFAAMLMIQGRIILAQEKTFVKEYTYKAGEMDSKISCRAIATNQLRTELLNEIGVYVESEQLLKTTEVDGKFSQDFVENIATISAGITKLEVIEERWNGEAFWMKAAITVDRKSLENSLKQLVNDRQKVKEFEELKKQLKESSEQLVKLTEELNSGKNESEQAFITEKYNSQIVELNRTDFIYNANVKLAEGDYTGAIQDYNKAIELNPEYANVYYGRGLAKKILGDFRGAIKDCTKAIELDPSDAYSYLVRGLSKSGLGDYKAALKDYTRTIEIGEPQDALAKGYGLRGVTRIRLGDKKGACQDWSKAGELGESMVYEFIKDNCGKY